MQAAILPLRGSGGEQERDFRALVEVVRRAWEAGVLRPDLTPEDLAGARPADGGTS